MAKQQPQRRPTQQAAAKKSRPANKPAPAKKAPAKKTAPAKKAPAKKAPVKKAAPAKKAPAKKSAPQRAPRQARQAAAPEAVNTYNVKVWTTGVRTVKLTSAEDKGIGHILSYQQGGKEVTEVVLAHRLVSVNETSASFKGQVVHQSFTGVGVRPTEDQLGIIVDKDGEDLATIIISNDVIIDIVRNTGEDGDALEVETEAAESNVDESGDYTEAGSDEGGYYDEDGNWVDTTEGEAEAGGEEAAAEEGYYDEDGNWVEGAAAEEEAGSDEGGYYDDNGEWVDTTGGEEAAAEEGTDEGGYYDEDGNWVDTTGGEEGGEEGGWNEYNDESGE